MGRLAVSLIVLALGTLTTVPAADAIATFCVTPHTMPPVSHGADCPGGSPLGKLDNLRVTAQRVLDPLLP